ncbi:MAG: hypothetical protein M3Z59_06185, partial [Bombella apis]|nr:hypothetical protein [Bombella apis]
MKKSVRYAALLSSLVAGTYGATAQLYAADAAGTNSVSTMSDDKAKVKSVKKADKTASTSTSAVAT